MGEEAASWGGGDNEGKELKRRVSGQFAWSRPRREAERVSINGWEAED